MVVADKSPVVVMPVVERATKVTVVVGRLLMVVATTTIMAMVAVMVSEVVAAILNCRL